MNHLSHRLVLIIERYFTVILLSLVFIVFYKVFTTKELPDIDFSIVVAPLEKVKSFSDYKNLGLLSYDLQPIRDLYFILVSKISNWVGFPLYGLFNLFLWIFSILTLRGSLSQFVTKINTNLISLIVFVHPISAWVVAWPSAAKHLLALMFISIATHLGILLKKGVKKRHIELGIIIFYLLAITSQPITIFWPIVLFLYLGNLSFERDKKWLLGLLFFTMILFLILNFFYYQKIYPMQVGASKISVFSLKSLVTNLLAISRSFSQILLPIHYSTFYSYSSMLNFVGLPLFLLVFTLLFKKRSIAKNIFYLVLITYPFVVVYSKETNIFVSDTYLLIPLFSFALYIATNFLNTLREKSWMHFVLIFILLVSTVKTRFEVSITTSNSQKSIYSYKREPECKNALSLALFQLYSYNIEGFKVTANQAIANLCAVAGMNSLSLIHQIYGMMIFLNEEFTLDQKISLLEKTKTTSVVVCALLLKLYAKKNDKENLTKTSHLMKSLPVDLKMLRLVQYIQKNL